MSIIRNIDSRIGIVSLIALLLESFAATASGQKVVINEIMPSNIDNLLVEHDYPDSWVEVYNPSNREVNLRGYQLGEKTKAKKAYRLDEDLRIPAHGYGLVYCDKKGEGCHTDFHLSASGGSLYLFDAAGQIVDQLEYPKMPAANIAFGRETDGKSSWGWQLQATPGASNQGGCSDVLLPDPEFNLTGRVLNQAAEVIITIPEGDLPTDTRLSVTTDGSEPTIATAKHTSWKARISENTVVRAKLFAPSALSRRSVTQSYIFHPRKTTLPILSIVTDSAHFYSEENGILSDHHDESGRANYSYEWRRPVNIEYLGLLGDEPLFNQVAETAVGGYGSRPYEEKSLKLYANKRFGKKNFKGQLWADKPNVTKAKSFVLRNGGSSAKRARINDGFVQRLFGHHLTNLDYQSYTAAIVYVNGKYYGEAAIRERTNDDYVAANYNGLDDIYIESHRAYLKDSVRGEAFQSFYDLYHTDGTTYEQLAATMDVDNFMKVLIAEMFASNYDFPDNNVIMWRPTEEGGRWRWILKDLDWLALYYEEVPADYNTFKFLFGTAQPDDREYREATRHTVEEGSMLYRKMMSFAEFREPFIDAFSTYLGDFLKPSVTLPLIDQMHDEIADELKATWQTYGWTTSLTVPFDSLRSHTKARQRILYHQMADFFNLGKVVPMTIRTHNCPVEVNGIGLTEGDFDGCYYSERPLTLTTEDTDCGWEITLFDEKGKPLHQQTFDEAELTLTLSDYPMCSSVRFSTYRLDGTPFADSDDTTSQGPWIWYIVTLLLVLAAGFVFWKNRK